MALGKNKKDQATLDELLAKHEKPLWWKVLRWIIVILIIAGALWFFFGQKKEKPLEFITTDVVREPIDVSVTADGTLNPTRVVSLGSSLSGIVDKVNVDVNDAIHKGQVLIELDPTNLKAKVLSAESSLAIAKAKQKEAQATFNEVDTKYRRLLELKKLSGGKLPTAMELESQKARLETARAGLALAQAQIDSAKASVTIAKTDLDKSKIRSPIDGVVLARKVEPGYAVAASLQAVQLLELATDLKELELEVTVDEADIGVVKPGQVSSFTVSSYPNRKFPAELVKVAYGATRSGNVVTYTAYLRVKNTDNLLRPGMTASTTIATAHEDNALVVPNSAFRFEMPDLDQGKGKPKIQAGPPHRKVIQKHRKDVVVHGEAQRTLYVLRDGKPELITVTTGLSNGMMTAVDSDQLKVGDRVIIDVKKAVKK